MKKLVFIGVLLFLFLGVVAVVTIGGHVSALGERDAILSGKKVTVEISGIETSSTRPGHGSIYFLSYEYYDENGTRYIGQLKEAYNKIEQARSQLGRKVEIYIDGKGNSIPVGDEPAIIFSLVFAIVFSTVFVLYIIFCIIVVIKYRKWCKKMEPIWAEKRKQNEAKKLEETEKKSET